MKKMIVPLFVGLLLSISGCEVAKPAEKPKPAATQAAPDNWTRMKECAAQADRIAQRERQEEQRVKGSFSSNYESHYSSADQRCYVRETSTYIEGQAVTSYVYLIDGFENRTVAVCHTTAVHAETADLPNTPSTVCQIGEENASHAEVEAFIKERMTK